MRYRVALGVILVSIVFIALQLNYLEATTKVEITSVLGEGFVALLLMVGLFIPQRLRGERDVYTLLTLGLAVLYFHAVTDLLDEFIKQPDYFTYIFEDFFQVLGIGLIIFGMMKWITERKRAEEEINQAAEEWETTFNSIEDLVSIQDKDFKLVRVNKAYADVFNMKPKGLIGKICYEIIHGTKEPAPNCPHKQTLETRKSIREEFFEPRLGIHCEVSASPIFNEKNQIAGTVHIVKDITERKREEEEVRQSEEKYRTLVEHSLQGITIIQDIPPRLVFANSTMDEILGYTAEEVLSLSAEETRALVHPEDQEFVWERYQHRLSGKTAPPRYEYRGVHKDGTIRWLEVSASRIEYRKGPAVLAALVDITERKRAEEELKRKNEELESFIYTVSHDLKTPLITVQGFVSALKEDYGKRLDEEARRQLGFIRDASKKMEALVKDLQELSRIGRVVHPKEEVDSSQVVEESVKGFKKRIKERGIELVVADEFPVIRCERHRMMQVMENLLSNAVKFMGDNPSPRIEVGHREEEDGFHRFWVKDNGIGIDPQYHGKIFELFQSLGEVEDEEGTGVGLTIVRRVIEQHGGRVWLESAEGQGSTFYFTFPRN